MHLCICASAHPCLSFARTWPFFPGPPFHPLVIVVCSTARPREWRGEVVGRALWWHAPSSAAARPRQTHAQNQQQNKQTSSWLLETHHRPPTIATARSDTYYIRPAAPAARPLRRSEPFQCVAAVVDVMLLERISRQYLGLGNKALLMMISSLPSAVAYCLFLNSLYLSTCN